MRPNPFSRFLCLSLASLVTSATLPAGAQTQFGNDRSDSAAVLRPVHAMFDAMAQRDPAAIKAQWLPGGTLVLMRDGEPDQMTVEAFASHIKPSATRIEERIHNPLIRVDNDLAVVWAPFDFLVDGKEDHCGTDLFNLVRVHGQWLIASVADTGRKNCPTS